MTDRLTDDDVTQLRELAGRASAGPWHWAGHKNPHSGPYLGTWLKGRGRFMVMGFRRLGMRGAQPTFRDDQDFMVPAFALAVQEVEYRDDINDIDNPDAQWIAAAYPERIAALCDELLEHRHGANRQTIVVEPA